ncbi:glycosyltransferase [beta proteobacterium MWH-UniP1]
MSLKKSKIVMLGFLVEQDYFDEITKFDLYPQVAARKHELGYFRGFVENNFNVDVFGFCPSSTYRKNKKIFFGFRQWSFWGCKCYRVPFINFIGLKSISRVISLSACLIKFLNFREEQIKICVYSTHTPLLLAANIINFFCKIDFYVIVADLPVFMNVGVNRSKFFRFFKSLDVIISMFLLARANGFSVVSKYILTDVPALRGIPAVVIEGIFQPLILSNNSSFCKNKREYFLYSGGLNNAYGVDILLHSFMRSDIDAELWICGSGELVDYIKKCSHLDERIKYKGYLNQADLNIVQKNASALLMTRDPKHEYVKYSFPSKLIEFLGTGTPVIATRLAGVPDVYYRHVTIIKSVRYLDIEFALKSHLNRHPHERQMSGLLAKKFIEERCSPRAAVVPFLEMMGLHVEFLK